MDGIGTRPRLRAEAADKQAADRPQLCARMRLRTCPTRSTRPARGCSETQQFNLVAAGHRVVHGGPDYAGPVLINERVLARLEGYNSLAPLHQPNNLAPIRVLRALRPDLPQVACFDTAFHRTHGGRSPTILRFPNIFTRRAFGAMASTASLMSTLRSVCAKLRQTSPMAV